MYSSMQGDMQTLHLLWELKCSAIFRIATWRIMFANAMQIRFPFSESFVVFPVHTFFLSSDLPSPFSILQIRIESNARTHSLASFMHIGLVNVHCTNIQQCESDIFPFHSMMPANKVNNRKICQSIPGQTQKFACMNRACKMGETYSFRRYYLLHLAWPGLRTG